MGPNHLQPMMKSTKNVSTSLSKRKQNPWVQPGVFKLLKATNYLKEFIKKNRKEKWILNKRFVLPEDLEKLHYTE